MLAGRVRSCLMAVTVTATLQTGVPAVGDRAPNFTLRAIDGQSVTLSQELQRGPVVLVLLRGWPGYQCPFCVAQYGDFLRHQDAFAASGARVIWVYPGPGDVKAHAEAFAAGQAVPAHFRLTLDPDYAFTLAYRLRWDGRGETAYPSTMVIDRRGTIRWITISRTHGGRAEATDVVGALRTISGP